MTAPHEDRPSLRSKARQSLECATDAPADVRSGQDRVRTLAGVFVGGGGSVPARRGRAQGVSRQSATPLELAARRCIEYVTATPGSQLAAHLEILRDEVLLTSPRRDGPLPRHAAPFTVRSQ